MKTYKGQIDETWTEIDLTQFKKENPKWDNKINPKDQTKTARDENAKSYLSNIKGINL